MKKLAFLIVVAGIAGALWWFLSRSPTPVRNDFSGPVPPGDARAQFPEGMTVEFIFKFPEADTNGPTAGASSTTSGSDPALFDVDRTGQPYLLMGRSLIAVKHTADSDAALIRLPAGPPVSSLAWMVDGSPLIVEGNRLAVLASNGTSLLQTLPQTKMRVVAASANQCYLFGGEDPQQQRNVYLFKKGGELLHLLQAEASISAVAGDGEFTFIAIDKVIYLLALGDPLTPVLRLKHPVTSLAMGPNSSLFFSTTAGVGVGRGANQGQFFIEGSGAELQIRDKTLYVHFPKIGIMRCTPIDLLLKPEPQK